MASHFHQLKIKKIVKETPECISVSFDVPEILMNKFQFKEGQNLTLRQIINGEDLRRSYSICSSPSEKELKIAIKKQKGGKFSSFANENFKVGNAVDVMQPTGKFSAKLKENSPGKYLAIAAGSGITPVIAIIKHTLEQNPENEFTLVYGNRNRPSIIFFEELEGLKNKYLNRFSLMHILSKEKTDTEIFNGRIDAEKLSALSKTIDYKNMDAVYICGPEEMIFSSSDFLKSQQIDEDKIHFELFTTPGQKFQQQEIDITELEIGEKADVTIKLDGRSFDFQLAKKGKSVLDGALQQGADLPFACKGGVCATCKAKLLEGEVRMDVNYALEKEEVANGFILTCQSHPVSDKVVIDYDQSL